ncbi:MAG: saccharopine dehydrogenase NADP-binding domain-containing protein [Gemmatimonadetes bacterium]|nr:saccharopine dehydrogenase NADP-binding domain-containing protein [Gemmatimonadota bacterium]
MADWMIYGATGYTGELIVAEALAQGLKPVLAGRNAEKVAALATRHGLAHRAFALDDAAAVAQGLAGMQLVLHCAGPFFRTFESMLAGCLAAKVHYLDITGEIAVFEGCARMGDAASAAGITVMPGVGFDVVPSDCLAASLKAALPAATSLELAFGGGAGWSRGTAKTMVSGLGQGGAVRRGGKIRRVPMAYQVQQVRFHDKVRTVVSIPWGDIATAWRSTRIPDITTSVATPPSQVTMMKVMRYLGPLLGLPVVQRWLTARVDAQAPGPAAEARASSQMQLWGRVRDASGVTIEGTLTTPEGYTHTAQASVACVRRMLAGGVAPGYQTPSLAFGAGFVSELPGCVLRVPATA